MLLLSCNGISSLELWGRNHFHKPDLHWRGEVMLEEPVTYPAISPGMYVRDVRLVLNMFREGRSRVFSNYSNCRVTATHHAKWESGSKCCQTVQEGEEEELIRCCLNTQLGKQGQKPQELKFLGSQWSTCKSSKTQVKNSCSSLEPKLRALFSSIYKQLSSSRGKQDISAEGNAGHPHPEPRPIYLINTLDKWKAAAPNVSDVQEEREPSALLCSWPLPPPSANLTPGNFHTPGG